MVYIGRYTFLQWLTCSLTTGLTDYCEEGKFKWKSDGSEVTEYKNWQKYQPDNTDDNEDCVHIDKENQWNDRRCLSRETASGNVMTALCQR